MLLLKILNVNSAPLNFIYNWKSRNKHRCALANAGKTLSKGAEHSSWLYRSCGTFYISREASSAERRYRKEIWREKNYMHMGAFSTRTCLLLPLSSSPPPLSPANAIRRAAGLRAISAPSHPLPPPPLDYGQILAASPKVEDGLHFGDCEYGS